MKAPGHTIMLIIRCKSKLRALPSVKLDVVERQLLRNGQNRALYFEVDADLCMGHAMLFCFVRVYYACHADTSSSAVATMCIASFLCDCHLGLRTASARIMHAVSE
jgi:hypothetical protein